jgi:ribA/ribD-fused uncharacterized protein
MSEDEVPEILSFTGEYRWLSNFHLCDILYEGEHYVSTEHAYQAAKSLDPAIRARFRDPAMTCGQAQRFGQKIPIRHDWDSVKIPVMRDVCTYKFTTHPDLREKLIATNVTHLEEGNRHGDVFWGTVNGQGRNELGIVLMLIRERLIRLELEKALDPKNWM